MTQHTTTDEVLEAVFSVWTAQRPWLQSDLDTVTADIIMLKLRCNKCNTYTERLIPPLIREETPISKHVHVWERTNILDIDLKETKARNDCAGKGQQQFN
jgi:hypothetical protein